jgi:hypothetical protein
MDLTGDLPASFFLEVNTEVTTTVKSNLAVMVQAYLELKITRAGLAASNLDVTKDGLTIVPTCAGTPTTCTWATATFALAPGATAAPSLFLKWHVSSTGNAWTLQALAN